jgi:Heat induced stress protein YflT
MSHPLVLALYPTAAAAAAAVRTLHAAGITRDQISIVARSHDEEGALAEQMDASPGVDIEDSRAAARLGELGGQVLAAIAMVLPGIGPIVTAGPLSAGLGEAAGHVAGSMASVLGAAGVPEARAEALQEAVQRGSVLVAVHCSATEAAAVRERLASSAAKEIHVANWTQTS